MQNNFFKIPRLVKPPFHSRNILTKPYFIKIAIAIRYGEYAAVFRIKANAGNFHKRIAKF